MSSKPNTIDRLIEYLNSSIFKFNVESVKSGDGIRQRIQVPGTKYPIMIKDIKLDRPIIPKVKCRYLDKKSFSCLVNIPSFEFRAITKELSPAYRHSVDSLAFKFESRDVTVDTTIDVPNSKEPLDYQKYEDIIFDNIAAIINTFINEFNPLEDWAFQILTEVKFAKSIKATKHLAAF